MLRLKLRSPREDSGRDLDSRTGATHWILPLLAAPGGLQVPRPQSVCLDVPIQVGQRLGVWFKTRGPGANGTACENPAGGREQPRSPGQTQSWESPEREEDRRRVQTSTSGSQRGWGLG